MYITENNDDDSFLLVYVHAYPENLPRQTISNRFFFHFFTHDHLNTIRKYVKCLIPFVTYINM